jgi:hypothetical protein
MEFIVSMKTVFANLITGLLLLFSTKTLCPSAWVGLTSPSVRYLFSSGFLMSERHAIFYANQYKATTGEQASSKSTLGVMPDTCVSFNFGEIQLTKNSSTCRSLNFFSKFFSFIEQMGLRIHAKRRGTIIRGQSKTGASIKKYWIDTEKITLGQQPDIDCLSLHYDRLISPEGIDGVVLYGVSRGAATTLSFMGSSYLDKADKKVKAVILEGCYDSFTRTFDYYGFLNRFICKKLAYKFLYTIDTKPSEPIDFIGKFPKDVPVLFVSSKKDNIVSYKSIRRLASLLKQAGHEHVYLLELANSSHIGYFCEDFMDAHRYKSAVHALYCKYGLPHDPVYASRGAGLLNRCLL